MTTPPPLIQIPPASGALLLGACSDKAPPPAAAPASPPAAAPAPARPPPHAGACRCASGSRPDGGREEAAAVAPAMWPMQPGWIKPRPETRQRLGPAAICALYQGICRRRRRALPAVRRQTGWCHRVVRLA